MILGEQFQMISGRLSVTHHDKGTHGWSLAESAARGEKR